MAKLIAFTAITGDKVLINPDHITKVSTHPANVTIIVLNNYGQVERVTHSIDEVERMVNGVNNA